LLTPRSTASAILANSDAIYIFGGYNTQTNAISSQILKYSISSDTIELAGSLHFPRNGGNTFLDEYGSIYYAGGWTGQQLSEDVFKYSSDSVELVSYLPRTNGYSASVLLPSKDGVYLIGGLDDPTSIVLFNMTTLTTRVVARLPQGFELPTGFTDGQGSAFLFGEANGRVLKLNMTTFSPTLGPWNFPKIEGSATSIWDDQSESGYILGTFINTNDEYITHSIIKFNSTTMTYEILPVSNFPGDDEEGLVFTSAVYVSHLNRIYFFGGDLYNHVKDSHQAQDGIWYIDLSLPEEPTTTTPELTTTPTPTTSEPIVSTTTLSPDLFSCVNKTNGMYPHPARCDMFINCHDDVMTEFECPEPLLFDPIEGRCNLPQFVSCDISCIGKENGFYPHPDCSLFYSCRDEVLDLFRCPPPLLFDPVNGRCDHPDDVQCEMNNKVNK
jgi:hypothetical protein